MSKQPIISDKPLTKEQIWGIPEMDEQIKEPADFCLYKKIRCSAWDDECQVEKCIQNAEH
jgi:hypothetical protein